MVAGALRHPLTLLRAAETQDAYGAATVAWVLLAQAWGSAEPVSGKEYFTAAQVHGTTLVRFRIRYLAGLTTKDRVLWQGRLFDLQAVLDVGGLGEQLELLGSEVPA